MISSYDYYKQIESPNMYLCNPDRRFICALNGENRHLVLRFNDLSELTFTVPKLKDTETYYNLIESKRLIFIEKIGWFQIVDVSETTEGDSSSKDVTAQSHQYSFKDRGFVTEERLYMFYNPNDPLDEKYDSSNALAIPSVVGQLYQQLGVKVLLNNADTEPTEDKGDWTIIYIDPILKFHSKSYGEMYVAAEHIDNVCRGFEAKDDLNGYDFMINQVEKAFEVIFEFDILRHTIKVKILDDITKPTNIYLAFDNLVTSLNIKESAEDIVTVMSCNGSDIDIRTVNPMGTNYIANFDYYKKRKSDDGKIDYPWMSKELIAALDAWEVEFEKWQHDDDERTGHTKSYSTLVKELQELYMQKTQADADIQYANLKLTDMQVARDQYINGDDKTLEGEGYVTAETVNVDGKSLLPASNFYGTNFTDIVTITGHTTGAKPTKGEDGRYTFSFDDAGVSGTPKTLIQNFIDSKGDEDNASVAWYFMDGDNRSYCKLNVASEVGVVKDEDGNISTNGTVEVRGVTMRVVNTNSAFAITFPDGTSTSASQSNSYFIYDGARYRILASADGIVSVYAFYVSGLDRYTTYAETVGDSGWCSIWENHINRTLTPISNNLQNDIEVIEGEMTYINTQCNIQQFIKRRGQELYDELSNYWIEGDYSNGNIATYDTTTMSERIDLAKELMNAGKVDLAKCSQPQFEMTVDALNFIKMYEFRQFTNELVLGRIITIEKCEGVCFRPALMTIEYDLDVSDSFSMTFSNASKPGDTSMTFADLLKETSSAARTVSANWSNLTDYSRNKEKLTSMINAPLDRSLRAMREGFASQAFIIDEDGILGRKYDQEFDGANGTFSPEQVRIINNTIIFTNDNWETASTALGKVTLPDGSKAYGLVAEAIIGELILGETVIIGTQSERVKIDNSGILIKNDDGDVVFEADANGNINLIGVHAIDGEFSGTIKAEHGEIGGYIIDRDTLLGDKVGMKSNNLASSQRRAKARAVSQNETTAQIAFWAGNTVTDDAPFRVYNDGYLYATNADIRGAIHATEGEIGAFTITDDGLESDYIKLNSKEIRFPIQSIFNLNDEVTIYTSQAGGANTSYITTVNSSNFVIQNLSGAGIKFSKDKTTVSQTITMTFSGPDLSSAGNMGNALTINYTKPSGDWGASYDFHYTATLSAALPYPCTKTAYVKYLYDMGKTEYRTKSITLNFPAFTTSISGSVNLDSCGEIQTRYNPNDIRFETGVYFSSYTRSNQASVAVTSFSSTNNTLYSLGHFSPEEDKQYSLGSNGNAWGNLYLYSGTQVGSDRRLKNSIEKLSSGYEKFFDGLMPVSYILNDGSSHRRHIGFIAQDVERSLANAGIDTKDFAGLCAPSEDEMYYMLRYDEFIALNTFQIQRLKNRVDELERTIALLQK